MKISFVILMPRAVVQRKVAAEKRHNEGPQNGGKMREETIGFPATSCRLALKVVN
jgi:hypothetical protein